MPDLRQRGRGRAGLAGRARRGGRGRAPTARCWPPRATRTAVPAGLGDQAAHRLRRADRGRGGRGRVGHPGRPGRLHGAAPDRAHLRRSPSTPTGSGRARAPGASTPTPASSCSGETVADAAGMPFDDYLHDAVFAPLGMTATTLTGSPAADARLHRRRPRPLRRRAADPDPGRPDHPGRGHRGRLPRPGRRAPRLRPAAPERLGPGLRDPRRQVAALDRRRQLAADVRALRAGRHVPLGRSGRPGRRRRAHRPRLRQLVHRGLAAAGPTVCSPRCKRLPARSPAHPPRGGSQPSSIGESFCRTSWPAAPLRLEDRR